MKREGEQHPDQSALCAPKDILVPFIGCCLVNKAIMEQRGQGHIHPSQEGNVRMGVDHIPIVEAEGENREEAEQQSQDGRNGKIAYGNAKMSSMKVAFHAIAFKQITDSPLEILSFGFVSQTQYGQNCPK